MSIARLVVGTLLVATAGQATVASADTVKAEDYVAGFVGDTDGLCAEDPRNVTGLNIGVVCFTSTRTRVRLAIDDASTLPVAGYYVFVGADGEPIGGAQSFCGRSGTAVILTGTKTVVVYIGGPALGPLACIVDHEDGYPGIGTAGSVTATFSG